MDEKFSIAYTLPRLHFPARNCALQRSCLLASSCSSARGWRERRRDLRAKDAAEVDLKPQPTPRKKKRRAGVTGGPMEVLCQERSEGASTKMKPNISEAPRQMLRPPPRTIPRDQRRSCCNLHRLYGVTERHGHGSRKNNICSAMMLSHLSQNGQQTTDCSICAQLSLHKEIKHKRRK